MLGGSKRTTTQPILNIMPKTEKAPAKRASKEVAVVDYGDDAAAGFENQTTEDRAIPFLVILQSNSPQVEAEESELKPGMLFNSVTEAAINGREGIRFVPAITEHVFVEWVPRGRGGGFVAVHEKTSDIVKTAKAKSTVFGKYSTEYDEHGRARVDGNDVPTGNDIVETFYVYGVILDENDEPDEIALIAFTSTKIKPYKNWSTKLGMFTIPGPDGVKQRPPLFAHKCHLSTVQEKNAKGTFYNFVIKPADGDDLPSSLLRPDNPAFAQAKALRDMVNSGMARVDHAAQTTAAGSGEEGPKPNQDGEVF